MSRCSEPLLWFCGSCSNPFELGEWQEHGRSCPVCHGKTGVWRCGKCHGEFGQPSLGSEHPCLAQSKPAHGTKLISKAPNPVAHINSAGSSKESSSTQKKPIFEKFIKAAEEPPVLVTENPRPKGVWKFFSTKGRSSRREYWLITLSTPFLLFGFLVFEAAIAAFLETSGLLEKGDTAGPAAVVFLLVGCPLVFWIYLAAFIRRRHDLGLSGKKRLNAFHTISLLFKKGDLGPNTYGPATTK